jgi:hypothetical protein
MMLAQEQAHSAQHNSRIEAISALFLQLSVLIRILYSDYVDPTIVATCLLPWHTDIVTSCDRMIVSTAFVRDQSQSEHAVDFHNDIRFFLRPVGMAIYRHFPECSIRSSQLNLLDVTMERAQREDVPHAVLWTRLLGSLAYQLVRQQCAAPGCDLTTEHHGRDFRFCTGCAHVQYCSRECQRKAWRRDDGLRHREVCAFIHNICAQHKISHETCTSDKDAPELDIPVLSQAEVYIVGKIIEHFAALSMHDLRV